VVTGSERDIQAFFDSFSPVCCLQDDSIVFRHPAQIVGCPMPVIQRQSVDLHDLRYIGFQNSKRNDTPAARDMTLGFFLPDSKFEHICWKPWDYSDWLAQYKQVLSPDLSCFRDMPLEEQWMSVFRNRLVGAFWQHQGLMVVATVSWADERSFGFCFQGLEKGSIVAVSTIGTGSSKDYFMAGFKEMCKIVEPEAVICYCNPYSEMYRLARIVPVEHEGRAAWRKAKYRPDPNQITIFDFLVAAESVQALASASW
jgi:hypothetical protein